MSGFATRAIRAASHVPDAPQAPVNVPIYQTSTFEFETAAELGDVLEFRAAGHSYSRYSNPTHAAFEAAIAELEGAEAAHVTGSGMAAIHAAIVSLVPAGGEVVAAHALYGGTYALLTGMLRRLGIGSRFVDTTDGEAVAAAIGPTTRLLWLETIANPTTAVPNIAGLAQLAHERGVAVVVDNTFASPYLCNPLALGADLVVHSVTKYIGGHSDLLAGVVAGDTTRVGEARHVAINAGGNANPFEVFLALRGLKTLALRMERHSASALAVARALEGAAGVAATRYPGLRSHPQHELACRQLRDGQAGGMLGVELAGGREAGDRFLRSLRVARHATSLGSVETLCSHPASSSHRQLSDAELSAAGLSPGMVRVSIGLEDPEDLIADLAAAAAGS